MHLHKIEGSGLPANTFILCSKQTRSVLFQPHLAGKRLQDLLEKASVVLAKAIAKTALRGTKRKEVMELVFLCGGFYYDLNHGFKKAFGFSLQQSIIGIKRFPVGGGAFEARAAYQNFEALPENPAIVIGDTIATGATLEKGLACLAQEMEKKKIAPKKLVVCSLACSVDGARKLKEIEATLKQKWPALEVYLIACEELFHLMPDGTDLRFLYDDAVIPEETRKAVLEEYGPVLGRKMKCAVFDWGTRCKNPLAHYKEFAEYAERALEEKGMDAKSRRVLEGMLSETRRELKKLEEGL